MKRQFGFLMLLTCLAGSAIANASVWDDQSFWSIDWEAKYASWVSNEFKVDTFAVRDGNTFATQVNPDEIPYLARALFAYRNQLPFIVRGRASSATFVTNRSSSWDSIPEGDARVAQFLKDIRANLSYDRLALDSFPLALTKQAIQPGTFFLNYESFTEPDAGSSSMFVKSTQDQTGFLTYLFTSRQEEVRPLTERAPIISEPPTGRSGFMALRWPNEKLNGLENHFAIKDPRFSANAQYQASLALDPSNPRDSFTFKVQEATSGTAVSVKQELYQEAYDFCLNVRSRVDWVNEAVEYVTSQRTNDPSFAIKKGTPAWELLSTPWRDSQIFGRFDAIRKKYRLSVPDADVQAQFAACTIQWGSADTQKMTLLEYRDAVTANLISSDPNDPRERRWGRPVPAPVPPTPAPAPVPAPEPAPAPSSAPTHP